MKSTIVSAVAAGLLFIAGGAFAAESIPADLVQGLQCGGCHKLDSKMVGPSWHDVSKFYNGKMDKTTSGKTLKDVIGGRTPEDALVEKISKGGGGNWGKAAMPATDVAGAKQAQIKKIAEFILSLEK
jgi:cytochrome c